MSDHLAGRVEQACQELAATDTPITFPAIAQQAGISRATLYRRPELRALVEEHRQHARESLILTGLAVQLDQLRTTLDAIAAKVRHHEDELRTLRRRSSTATA